MTREEKNNKLKHFITCLKCEVSGKHCDVNCSTQYDAGNMGEIIENLEAISKVLEQEPVLNKIRSEIEKEIIPRNSDQYDHEAMWQNSGLRMALKVIDKYKAESEEK